MKNELKNKLKNKLQNQAKNKSKNKARYKSRNTVKDKSIYKVSYVIQKTPNNARQNIYTSQLLAQHITFYQDLQYKKQIYHIQMRTKTQKKIRQKKK